MNEKRVYFLFESEQGSVYTRQQVNMIESVSFLSKISNIAHWNPMTDDK